MLDIIRVAITGAPCSGKTTAINFLCKIYKKENISVLVCPEAATSVINQGMKRLNYLSFETEVAKCQIKNEKLILEKAKDFNGKLLVLYDRALTDCFSYVDDKETLAKNIGIDYISTWNRYDSVIMLEVANEDVFVNDELRFETYQKSLELQEKLKDVFVGHPHLRFIKNTNYFNNKIQNLKAEIDTILNDVEIEKKYLIKYPNFEELKKVGAYRAEISQTYLLNSFGSHRIRMRRTDDIITYFETLKIRMSGMSAKEEERIITREEYNKLMINADPEKNTITKDRYCFLFDGQYFELDVFPFWNDKAFLELELTNENQIVNLPPFIDVIKDVSNDKHYKNNYLAGLRL